MSTVRHVRERGVIAQWTSLYVSSVLGPELCAGGGGKWLGVCDGSLGGEECKEEDEGLSLVAGL